MENANIRRDILRVEKPIFLRDVLRVKKSNDVAFFNFGSNAGERAEPDQRKRIYFVLVKLSGAVEIENQFSDKLAGYVYARYGEQAEEKARAVAINLLKKQKSKEIIENISSKRSHQQDISKVSKLIIAE